MKVSKLKKHLGILLSCLLVVALVGCSAEGGGGKKAQQINLMTWADFIPREIINDFEAETGIKVNYKDTGSNEEMQSLLEANPDQYDLAVVTDYMVDILRRNGSIAKLDKAQLSNFGNINPVYQGNYYDEGNEYSFPYAISTSFLLVNQDAVAALGAKPITGYADLWQPELKSNVVVVDWSVEVMGIALKALGYEYNETDPAKVAAAKEKLFALRPNIMRFETNTPEDSLISGEAVAGFMYSNQAVKGNNADDKLVPVFPHEGMPIFIDAFVMSKSAPNAEAAYKFLNYLLRPDVSAKISEITNFVNANSAAQEHLSEEFKSNIMLNIPDEVMANTDFYVNVDKVLDEYEHIYSEFKIK